MKFLRENEDQLRSQSMLSKLERGECNDFGKEIKALLATNSGRHFWGKQYCEPMARSFQITIANFDHSTGNRDQAMNALRTVPGHNDVINVHELRQIVKGLKNNRAVGNDGIPSEVYKFASERLLTIIWSAHYGC